MAIEKRSSKFLRSPTSIPTNTTVLINSLEGKIDENTLNLFKAIAKDLDEYKTSMYGITRRFDDDLFLFNKPTTKETDVMEAARMDKNGYIAINTEYPRWPRARVDVNGSIYGIPQWARFAQTTDIAAAGNYTWDTELFNNATDIYIRQNGNTEIRITEPGNYQVNVGVHATASGILATQSLSLTFLFNAASVKFWQYIFLAASPFTRMPLGFSLMIRSLLVTDFISIALGGSGAGITRFGTAAGNHCILDICKVN